MSKRAFVVCGVPSSGTRLLVRILIAGGCVGDGDHAQRWDTEEPDADLIVIRRHQPMGRPPAWASNPNLIIALQNIGYEVAVLIMSRDWHSILLSQLNAPHVGSVDEGVRLTRQCWRMIFKNLPDDVPFEIISYESLIQRPHDVRNAIYAHLALIAIQEIEPISDGNEKYYPYPNS